MEIKQYTLNDLRELLKTEELWTTQTIPITKHRLISFLHNPRAKDDDVVFLVGYNNNDVMGYVAIVPDFVYPNGEEHRVGWLGAIWSNPDPKNSMLAGMLLFNAYKAFNQSVAESIAADEALRLFKASRKFVPLKTSVGYQYLLKSNLYYWIPRKIKFAGKLLPVIKLADFGINIFQNLRLARWKSKNNFLKNHKLEYLSEIRDNASVEFINAHNKNDLTRKTADDINSIVKYPSSLATPLEDHIKSRYYFSIHGHRHNYLIVKVLDNENKIRSIIVFNIDGNHLIASFAFYDKQDVDLVVQAIVHHAIALKAEMFTTFSPALIDAMKRAKVPYVFRKKRVRESLISKMFSDKNFDDLYMHDGDGA